MSSNSTPNPMDALLGVIKEVGEIGRAPATLDGFVRLNNDLKHKANRVIQVLANPEEPITPGSNKVFVIKWVREFNTQYPNADASIRQQVESISEKDGPDVNIPKIASIMKEVIVGEAIKVRDAIAKKVNQENEQVVQQFRKAKESGEMDPSALMDAAKQAVGTIVKNKKDIPNIEQEQREKERKPGTYSARPGDLGKSSNRSIEDGLNTTIEGKRRKKPKQSRWKIKEEQSTGEAPVEEDLENDTNLSAITSIVVESNASLEERKKVEEELLNSARKSKESIKNQQKEYVEKEVGPAFDAIVHAPTPEDVEDHSVGVNRLNLMKFSGEVVQKLFDAVPSSVKKKVMEVVDYDEDYEPILDAVAAVSVPADIVEEANRQLKEAEDQVEELISALREAKTISDDAQDPNADIPSLQEKFISEANDLQHKALKILKSFKKSTTPGASGFF